MSLATCSSALEGMQPRYRQTPPGLVSGSTRVTVMPRSAARKAAAYPPGPPPTTAIFKLELSDIRSFFRVAQRFQRCGIAPCSRLGLLARGSVLSLNRKQKRLLKSLGDPAQKA